MNVGDAFNSAALEMNRNGRLSDDQQQTGTTRSRSIRKGELNFAILVTLIGLVVWFAPGPTRYATAKPLLGIIALLIAVFLLLRALTGADHVTEDVRSGEVRSIDGAIAKHVVQSSSASGTSTHYFDVAGQRLRVGRHWYEAAPDAGWVRVFYLPRSHEVINLEVLPVPNAPQWTPASAHELAEQLQTAMRSHDETKLAESLARGHAMQDQLKENMHRAAVPPPPEKRDRRPLAEAIVGSWSGSMLNVTFSRDGTVTASMPGGHQRSGHWSVGADGKLHADALGDKQAADAWISGDQLTISVDNMGLTFTRTGSG